MNIEHDVNAVLNDAIANPGKHDFLQVSMLVQKFIDYLDELLENLPDMRPTVDLDAELDKLNLFRS